MKFGAKLYDASDGQNLMVIFVVNDTDAWEKIYHMGDGYHSDKLELALGLKIIAIESTTQVDTFLIHEDVTSIPKRMTARMYAGEWDVKSY